jgi:hypothetical protein
MLLNVNDKLNMSDDESPYFLWQVKNDGAKSSATFYKITGSNGDWKVNQSTERPTNERYWYWVDPPLDGVDPVPGTLPLFGAGAAYGWSRRLRKRIRRGN